MLTETELVVTELPPSYPKDALPPGTQLKGYTIKSVLGRGTFGITYLAEETHLERLVAIKEYLPEMAATREDGSQVVAKPGNMGKLFQQELSNFLKEAKTLVKFDHPNIVRVLTYFPALGTAYLVMQYEVGMDLNEYLKRHPRPSEKTLLGIFSPIVQGLSAVHASGYIHRDIKAGNIYIREDESPVLLDFGAARNVISADVNDLTRILTVGYAPYEQDNPSWSEQGPWTDIYALAATLYYCLMGKRPVSSTERAGAIFGGHEDPIKGIMSLRPEGYSLNFLAAIDKALRFKPEERPQSAKEWDAMLNEPEVDKTVLAGFVGSDEQTQFESGAHVQSVGLVTAAPAKSKRGKVPLVAVSLVVIGFAVYFLNPSLLQHLNVPEVLNSDFDKHSIVPEKEQIPALEPNAIQALDTPDTNSKEADEQASKELKTKQEAELIATLEQSKSTLVSSLLLGKTALWHFARGEKISDLIVQIKSLPETSDRTRFIVDQENKIRESEEGFNDNYTDYQASIEQLKQYSQSEIHTALESVFEQPRYANDQTYQLLSQLIRKHTSQKNANSSEIRADLIELSRSNAFVDS